MILLAGGVAAVVRFGQGLGTATNLSHDNPWGLWIGFDLLCGVALAAGGYVISSTVYLFGLKAYQPIVRPAILTAFLGYAFVVLALLFDLGRPWRLPYPFVVQAGFSSVMFEVAVCVATYCTVLFVEATPPAFEWLGWRKLRAVILHLTIPLTILGVILSTMHQSSLGGLFLIAPGKLHPLWYSPYLPVFFFISSIIAGLSMIVVEGSLSHRALHHRADPGTDFDALTIGLARAGAIVMFSYFALKILGVISDGNWTYLPTAYGSWFLVEVLGFVLVPCLLFASAARNRRPRQVKLAALLSVLGVVLNRLNVSLVAFNWQLPCEQRYFPSWMELAVTLSIILLIVLVFRSAALRMPILRPDPTYPEHP
ncbi:MAG: hypothetical protein A2284_06140 [Deltaproteobacteria bacterium RIFOXYA12_FULL_61_11]|nr:MAG: hypothetical protein A2284_06140 [Deltaproteobacteria bacterium RIFOXYA12_FULL_61_11]